LPLAILFGQTPNKMIQNPCPAYRTKQNIVAIPAVSIEITTATYCIIEQTLCFLFGISSAFYI